MKALRRELLSLMLVVGLGASILPAQAAVLSPADRALLKRVDERYNHLHSLRTSFTEIYDGLGQHRDESGTMLLSKPGRMRWSYTEPRGKLFVLDAHYAYSYAPGDAQAQRLPAKQVEDMRSPLRLLLGHTQLQKELVDILVRPEEGGRTIISGTPAGPPAQLHRLDLAVTQEGVIQELLLTEQDGSRTRFVFKDTEENVAVSDRDFVFSPPIGVPIVNGMPPI